MKFHADLMPEQWFAYSFMMQLANVGSDVSRAIRWKNEGDIQSSEAAFQRALELLNLTILDPKNKGPKLKELCRAKELLISYFMFNVNECDFTDESWQAYFFAFSYAAALERGR
jgi:hypothetical protein